MGLLMKEEGLRLKTDWLATDEKIYIGIRL